MSTKDNVITGNDGQVFYRKTLAVSPNHADKVIQTIKSFAREKGMTFLLARDTLPPGDLNVSANGPHLNVKVMHTASVGDTGFEVFAISRGDPTPVDRQVVSALMSQLQSENGSP